MDQIQRNMIEDAIERLTLIIENLGAEGRNQRPNGDLTAIACSNAGAVQALVRHSVKAGEATLTANQLQNDASWVSKEGPGDIDEFVENAKRLRTLLQRA